MSDLQINPILRQSGGATQFVTPSPQIPSGTSQLDLAGMLEESGLANFNERAGVNRFSRSVEHVQLQQRRLVLPTRLSQKNTKKDVIQTDDVDPRLRLASVRALQTLQSDGQSALQDHLEHAYDVLERHSLLRSARAEVEHADLDPLDKANLKDTLTEMLGDLMDVHGDVIRSGLKATASFESALGTMVSLSQAGSELDHADSIRELRAQFGAKGEAKFDAPLTPYELAESLQSKFGADNFSSALGDLRSKMSAEFRSNPAGAAGPRLWLSLSDAAAFNAVQTSFSIAGDLRRDLSERAGISPSLHQAGTSLALLNAAQTGASSANVMVGSIIGEQELSGFSKANAFMAIRHAINQMPVTFWSPELLSSRFALLDHCRNLAVDATGISTPENFDATDIAKQLRQRVQRKKPRDERKNDGEEGNAEHKHQASFLEEDTTTSELQK